MGNPCQWEPILNMMMSQQILQRTGITPECMIRVNPFDTVVEVVAEVLIVAGAQQLHLICEWEEIPVNVSCMMGKKEYIMDVLHHSSEMIEQKGETEKEIQQRGEAEKEIQCA